MSSVVAAGGLGGVDPATDAAVDVDATPALVAVARASGVRVYAVDVVESVAAETSSYAPDAETFAAMSQVRNPDVAGSKPAVVAWSASRTGVCYYAGRATAGKVVVFDADGRAFTSGGSRARLGARVSPSPPANAAETSSSSAATRAPSGSKFHRRWCPGSSRNRRTDRPARVPKGNDGDARGVQSATWNEDGRVAYVAAGSCVYACQDPRRNVR